MKDAQSFYQRVLKVANFFLNETRGWTLEELKDFDPSVEKLAKNLRALATIVRDVAEDNYDDQNLAINAHQCCIVMEQIALAVERDKENEIPDLMKMLDMHANGKTGD